MHIDEFDRHRAAYTGQVMYFARRALQANGYCDVHASPNAPDTYAGLVRAYEDDADLRLRGIARFPVWNGGSEHVVFTRHASYSPAEVNFRFRALRDLDHITRGLGLSYRAEIEAAKVHVARFAGYPYLEQIATAETRGQLEFFERYGFFLEDQKRFAWDWLTYGGKAAIVRAWIREGGK